MSRSAENTPGTCSILTLFFRWTGGWDAHDDGGQARNGAFHLPMAAFSRRRGMLLVLNPSFVPVRGLCPCHKEQDERGASRAQRGSEGGKKEEMEELKSSRHPVPPDSSPCARSRASHTHPDAISPRSEAACHAQPCEPGRAPPSSSALLCDDGASPRSAGATDSYLPWCRIPIDSHTKSSNPVRTVSM